MTRFIHLGLIILLARYAAVCLSGPIEDMQPGEWLELPCVNKIRNILPSPLPAGNGPKSIISAWNSGAYDTKRDRLIITGGGHNDYAGNELYAFDINTFKWERIWGPSSSGPISRHTYDGLEYLPNIDRFWVHGGSKWSGGGYQTPDTWVFNFDNLSWTRKADYSKSTLEMVSAYDPATGNMIVGGPNSNNGIMEYNPITDKWTQFMDRSVNYGQTAALHPELRIFISVGSGDLRAYNLNAKVYQNWTNSAIGPSTITNARYPGIDYDPISKKLVAWSGGMDVYSLDVATKTWTKHTGTGDNPGAVFIVINSIDGNVFVYKHSDQSGVDLNPGTKRMDSAIRIVVNPNPFVTNLTIKIDCRLKIDDCRLKIYNANGKLVEDLTSKIKNLQSSILNQITWNPSDQPAGVYLVSVQTGNKTLSRKIVLTN
jgi:hypothetical protein